VRAPAWSGGAGPRPSTCAGGAVAAVVAHRRHLCHACAGPSLEVSMWWMVGLVCIGLLGRALAQDSRGSTEEIEVENAKRAVDWAIVRFNTDVQDFPSWEVFKTTVLSQVMPGTLGTCYGYSGGTVQVTREPLPREDKEAVWQKTTGNGWQQVQKDRTVIEYRVNTKAGLLLWIEGINPRFFFAYTRQMCEVPLATIRP
jgi:hypothetical protein